MYVVLRSEGASIAEVYQGAFPMLHTARIVANKCHGEIHEADEAAVRKIEKAVAVEVEMLETIRTGLPRRVRGAR